MQYLGYNLSTLHCIENSIKPYRRGSLTDTYPKFSREQMPTSKVGHILDSLRKIKSSQFQEVIWWNMSNTPTAKYRWNKPCFAVPLKEYERVEERQKVKLNKQEESVFNPSLQNKQGQRRRKIAQLLLSEALVRDSRTQHGNATL